MFGSHCQIIDAYDMQIFDNAITDLLFHLKQNPLTTLYSRLNEITTYFLDMPYALAPLGESEQGKYDQQPLYRSDCFDCLSYVSTCLACLYSQTLDDFKQHIQNINYRYGKISYLNRLHIMETDWNLVNTASGHIHNISKILLNPSQISWYKEKEILVEKANWLEKRSQKDLKRFNRLSKREANQLLSQLSNQSDRFPDQLSITCYISLDNLIDTKNNNLEIYSALPDCGIVQMIRPHWNIKQTVGTDLSISHLGFFFKKEQKLMLRHASSLEGKTIEVPITEYLIDRQKNSSLGGISIWRIIDIITHNHS